MKKDACGFIFSAACNSLSNMCNFDWNPCMVRNLDKVIKTYTISIPPPVLN